MVLIIMAMFTSTAFAAPAFANKSVILFSVEYQEGGMIIFFRTTGLTKDDLKNNSFYAHSNSYNMYCKFMDDTTDVRCVLSRQLAQYQGESFSGTLAGFGFSDTFPTNIYCPDGEIPWVSFSVFENGNIIYSEGIVPSKIWNQALAEGWFEYAAQNYGWTYEITGRFCSSEYFGPV